MLQHDNLTVTVIKVLVLDVFRIFKVGHYNPGRTDISHLYVGSFYRASDTDGYVLQLDDSLFHIPPEGILFIEISDINWK